MTQTATASRWTRFSRVVPVIALLALAACGTADNTPVVTSEAPTAYRLGTGDRVAVTVFGEKDMSGEFDVDDTGAVAIPLAGAVSVKDKTPREVEKALETQLTRGGLIRDPKVNVAVVKYRPIYILGEVQRPGAYPYQSGITVMNAVALAGGYTYRANSKRIDVVRHDGGDRTPQRTAETNYIAPGDTIIIPERWF
jgi:protein involved in polysaccharide export with SLBB domain